jgi:hypothetical protein
VSNKSFVSKKLLTDGEGILLVEIDVGVALGLEGYESSQKK